MSWSKIWLCWFFAQLISLICLYLVFIPSWLPAGIWFLACYRFTTFLFRWMAPKGSRRHHPYRSTTDIQTPTGSRSCSWYAGPGRQPAGDDPPPNRPILVLVDFSALQDLSHASEANSATCRALRPGNFRYTHLGSTIFSGNGFRRTHCQPTSEHLQSPLESMGHSHDSHWPWASLCWSWRRCFPSTQWHDYHSLVGGVQTWVASKPVQFSWRVPRWFQALPSLFSYDWLVTRFAKAWFCHNIARHPASSKKDDCYVHFRIFMARV